MSELRPMKFEDYFNVKFGLPGNELPTFAYRVMNNFGVYDGPEQYGSIHANFPVEGYAPDVLMANLRIWIAQELEVDFSLIRAEVILGKPVLYETVLEYINGFYDAVIIATGVMLVNSEKNGALHTVSKRHMVQADSEIHRFAQDIQKLRNMRAKRYRIEDDIVVFADEFQGGIQNLAEFCEKWKHMFFVPKPEVEPYSVQGICERVIGWQKYDVHIRNVVWRDKTHCEISLGNCGITLDQRAKTLKVTVHASAESGVNGQRHYSAQSPKTIDAALADVLAVEKYSWSTGRGHYNRNAPVFQYDAEKLRKWFLKLAKTQKLKVIQTDGEGHVARGVEESYFAMTDIGGRNVAAMRLDICCLHSEIEINVGDNLFNRVHFYHNTCEAQGKQNVEMYLADGLKRERARPHNEEE